jgi:RNA polymerase sigma-70 factor (ECF subfamily)
MRWELNDLARRFDGQGAIVGLRDSAVAAPSSKGTAVNTRTLRMLDAIEKLPDAEREVFELLRIQGVSYTETAVLLGVSESTVHRRLNRGLVFLEESLADLRPAEREG